MRAERDMRPSPARPPDRVRRATLTALAILLGAYAAAPGIVRLPAFDRWARERVGGELRARVGEATIAPGVAVDPLFRAAFGPVTIPGARAGEPLARIERIEIRPSLLALLGGRLEPASIGLTGVRIAAGTRGVRSAPSSTAVRTVDRTPPTHVPRARRGPARRARLVPGDPRPRPRGGASRRRTHGGARSRRRRGHRLTCAAGTSLAMTLRLPGGGEERSRPRSPATAGAFARLARLGPALLPPSWRDGPAMLEDGAVALELDADADDDLARVEARLRATGERLFVSGERIADAPLGPFQVAAEGTVTWDATERRVAFRDGVVSLGAALRVATAAEARLGSGVPFTATFRADGVDWAALVAALPPALAPPPEAPLPRGTFDARLDAAGPLLAPEAWTLGATLDLGRMREASRKGEPVGLRRPFPYQPVTGEGELGRAFEIGPRSASFVPVAELPEHVVRAVTTSEDAGFFGHPGFDFAELADAFARGAEEGRVVRGGSTITQQLAKNLYLSREKTLARKIREAAITIALEATVPKARLLEIYLNLVEWGPGVFGIGAAAQHWFGKDARALTAKEAAFLASIIPNPIRYHGMRARGTPSDAWEQRVDDILLKMTEQGALSDEDLGRALSEPIVFREG
jgi:hypothetical protein